MAYEFDFFVIGAGSGGVRAARLASGTGARVGIAEERQIGGTCVLRGCIPKKILMYASRFPKEFSAAAGFGWQVPAAPSFDWSALITHKDREIGRLSDIYALGMERAGVTVFATRATLTGPHEIALATGERVTAANILIATGGHPLRPTIPGAELGIVSDDALSLPALPASIAIVGGGYIALEFACIFRGLGAAVTLVHRGARLLRGFDADIQDHIAEELMAAGIAVQLSRQPTALMRDGKFVRLCVDDGDAGNFDAVLFATGRGPNTAGLGLETAGVRLTPGGFIAVDAYSRTSVPSIHAVGDVTGRPALTPVAIADAMRLVDALFHGNPREIDHRLIPTAVFSTPEIGTVGLGEAEARARGPIDIYKTRFRPMKNVIAHSDSRIFMKLVVCARAGTVLGAHFLGEGAAEMAQLVAIPLRLGATKADFDTTMALHPSAAEELVTMRQKWLDPAEMQPVAAQ